MITYLLVAIGGALGSMARYAVSVATAEAWGDAFPWGTILINVTGSLLIGLFAGLAAPLGPMPASQGLRVFFMVGVCGGYTTFSSFSLQTLGLMRGGEWLGALANVLLSAVLCILAVAAGHFVAQKSGVLFSR
jgi:CrcB protein